MRNSLECRWKSHPCLDEWSSRAPVTRRRSTPASPVMKGDERERKGERKGDGGCWVMLAYRNSDRQYRGGGFGEGMGFELYFILPPFVSPRPCAQRVRGWLYPGHPSLFPPALNHPGVQRRLDSQGFQNWVTAPFCFHFYPAPLANCSPR